VDEMNFDSDSQKSEDIVALLAAGFDHRKHSLDKAAAAGALRPKRELSRSGTSRWACGCSVKLAVAWLVEGPPFHNGCER
jgi:hypothetical protein